MQPEPFTVDSGIRYGGMEPEVMTLSLDSDAIVEQLGSPYGESQGDATLAGAVYGVASCKIAHRTVSVRWAF